MQPLSSKRQDPYIRTFRHSFSFLAGLETPFTTMAIEFGFSVSTAELAGRADADEGCASVDAGRSETVA